MAGMRSDTCSPTSRSDARPSIRPGWYRGMSVVLTTRPSRSSSSTPDSRSDWRGEGKGNAGRGGAEARIHNRDWRCLSNLAVGGKQPLQLPHPTFPSLLHPPQLPHPTHTFPSYSPSTAKSSHTLPPCSPSTGAPSHPHSPSLLTLPSVSTLPLHPYPPTFSLPHFLSLLTPLDAFAHTRDIMIKLSKL